MKIPTNWSHRLDNSDEHAVMVLTNDLLQPIGEFSIANNATEPFSICEIEVFAQTGASILFICSLSVSDIFRMFADPVECGQPGIPLDGKVHLNDKGSASYSCNEGFQLFGSAHRTCGGMKWRGNQPQCVAIQTDNMAAPSEQV